MAVTQTPAPLVGRQAELERLDAALAGLDEGREGCVAMEGEPGIGKTRLLAELRTRAEDCGHLVLSGAAAEFERDLPFSVWVDALDAYATSQGLDLDGALAAELADERFRAHRAVRALLGTLAGDHAVVLVLDDLHWADAASLELVASLVRRGAGAPVLLALAFRPGQAPEKLTVALAAARVERLALGPLSETQTAELVGPEHAAALYAHSGGNPFYLEELARAPRPPSGDGGAADDGVPAAVAAA